MFNQASLIMIADLKLVLLIAMILIKTKCYLILVTILRSFKKKQKIQLSI